MTGQILQERAKHVVRMMLDRAAANLHDPKQFPLPSGTGTFEHAFQRKLSRLSPALRTKIGSRAALSLGGASRETYGEAAALSPKSSTSLVSQTKSLRRTRVGLKDVLEDKIQKPLKEFGPSEVDLVVLRVDCSTKTSERFDFRDEISMAAIAHDIFSRTDKKLAPFEVDKFGRKNKGHVFTPPKVLGTFPVAAGGFGGQILLATTFLAETDFGKGFEKYVDHIGSITDQEFVELISLAATSVLLVSMGIAAGAPFGPLGMAIGGLVGAVVAVTQALVTDLARDWAGDDVFHPVVVSLFLDPQNAQSTEPLSRQTLRFERKDQRTNEINGIYTAVVEWRVRHSLISSGNPIPLPAATIARTERQALDNLDNIEHIVVVMMENRSFDQMLGFLQAERGRAVDGVDPAQAAERSNPLPDNMNGDAIPPHEIYNTALAADPGHSVLAVREQMFGTLEPAATDPVTMKGFVKSFRGPAQSELNRTTGGAISPGDLRDVMGYYPSELVPVYDLLATEFAVCDRWFCSFPGNTWVNRTIALSGSPAKREDASLVTDNDMPAFKGAFAPAFVRVLDQKGVSWRWYAQDFPSVWAVDREIGDDRDNIKGVGRFFEDARAGTLPKVSWVDPNFIDVGQAATTAIDLGLLEQPQDSYGFLDTANDDHPPADIAHGQNFVLQVFLALFNNPEVWRKTLLIITYDEHGGYYDHVPPPKVSHPEGSDFEYHGPRVPALVVSPWVGRGLVGRLSGERFFDHCSIIRTIFERFCRDPKSGRIPELGPRVAEAEHLGWLLNNNSARMQLGPFLDGPSGRSAKDSGRFRLGALGRQLTASRLLNLDRRAGKSFEPTDLQVQIHDARKRRPFQGR
ncbi:MAG: hypothetical protein JNL98_24310 [Bryobacterales bacterium]|nr:hypothetical protein [Bryobacterales bacterium]